MKIKDLKHSNPQNFELYCYEEKIVNIINNKFFNESGRYNQKEASKKKRELFHALVFLSLEGHRFCPSRISFPKDGEGADIEIITHLFSKNRAIEITECLDKENNDGRNFCLFQSKLDSIIGGDSKQGTNIENHSKELKETFFETLEKKNNKINTYKKKRYTTELLIVTYEAYDNCPTTGTWIEKFIYSKDVKAVINNFDKVYALIYGSSGRDGGPVVKEFPKDTELYQTILSNEP